MEIIREKTCCFSGHRPEKLKGSERTIRQQLRAEIEKAIEKGYDTFISGMAEGVDLWAAEQVLNAKKKRPEIKLVCAVPFKGVEKKRSEAQVKRFETVLEKADQVEYICPGYDRSCFQKRNRWMVDHAGMLIAIYNGTPGGTKATIEYAKEKGIDQVIVEDKEVQRCSICGKELDMWDLQETKLEFDEIMGFGSRYDCCHIRYRLCCSCFDKFIDGIRRSGKEDPVICTDVRFAGEMTNEQAKRLSYIFKFMNQAGADSVVEKIRCMDSEEIEAEITKLEEAFGVES